MLEKRKAVPSYSGKPTRKKLIISLLMVMGVIVLLEIGFRIYYASQPSTPIISIGPDYSCELVTLNTQSRISRAQGKIKLIVHPFLIYKNLPNQTTELYQINSLGLRGAEVGRVKAANAYRIIMTGGSATFGVGASSDANTVAYLLQEKLNSYAVFPKRVEVLNAGVIGYLSNQESVFLQTDLVDLNPDLIIAYNGYNDFFWPAARTAGCHKRLDDPRQVGFPGTFYELEQTLIRLFAAKRRSIFTRLLSILGSISANTAIGQRFQMRGSESHVAPDAWLAPGTWETRTLLGQTAPVEMIPDCAKYIVDNYERHIRMISELSAAWGSKSLLIVQPELGWKHSRTSEEALNRNKMLAANPWYESAWGSIYPQFLEAARRVAADSKAGFLDLRPILDQNSQTLFVDCVHLNDIGNDITAQSIAEYLASGGYDVQR